MTHTDHTQEVKVAVSELKDKGAAQAENQPREYRTWGWYEGIAVGLRLQEKRIVVNPGAALSAQSHNHRFELCIVIEGTVKFIIDNVMKLVTENQSVFSPLGAIHRMENPGRLPLSLIKVQTGSCFWKEDIIKYEGVDAQGQGAKG